MNNSETMKILAGNYTQMQSGVYPVPNNLYNIL